MPTPIETLKEKYVATQLSFHWWGRYRKTDNATKKQMTASVSADEDAYRVSNEIYSSKIPAIKEIAALKGEIRKKWEARTNPYPEDKIRLLLKEDLQKFQDDLDKDKQKMHELAQKVQESRQAIMDEGQKKLGGGWHPGLYPADLSAMFGVEVTYPSLNPPDYLPPAILEQQKAIMEAKFSEAAALTEQMQVMTLQKLVEDLAENLTPDAAGAKKKFYDAKVEKFNDFFERMKKLSLGSNEKIDTLVTEAKALLAGVDLKDMRKSDELRKSIQEGMTKLSEKLAPLVVNAPRRKVVKLQELEPSAA